MNMFPAATPAQAQALLSLPAARLFEQAGRLREAVFGRRVDLCAIINARIPRVVFGAPDPKAGSCGSVTDLFALPYNHRPACEGGVLEEECAQLLRDFFRALRLAPPKPRWKPAVLPAQGGDHA